VLITVLLTETSIEDGNKVAVRSKAGTLQKQKIGLDLATIKILRKLFI
jgi:hypothetical protein